MSSETDFTVERPSKDNKSSKINGFHLFYRETVRNLANEVVDGDYSAPDLAEMSKIGSQKWKALDDATRKEWNRKGQRKREEEDCGQNEELICEKCKRKFKRENEHRFHVKNCTPSPCSVCAKVFETKIALKKHTKLHNKDVVCTQCNKPMSSAQALKRHIESVHEEKLFPCATCKKGFSTQGNLKRHQKIHLDADN